MENKILNLTQHVATEEQVAEGVFEPTDKKLVQDLLTFDSVPNKGEMCAKAFVLACIAKEHDAKSAMIGGAPYFMSTLEKVLLDNGITPMYAFSVRTCVETVQPDGTVQKSSVFKHTGFYVVE